MFKALYPASTLALLAASWACSVRDTIEADADVTVVSDAGDILFDADENLFDADDPIVLDDAGPDAATSDGCLVATTCASAKSLGTIRGDIGTDSLTGVGNNTRWFKLHVDEGTKDDAAMRVTAHLAYLNSAGATYRATLHTSCTDATGENPMKWTDVAAQEDARDVYVRVERVSGATCTSWKLTLSRN